MRNVRRSPTGGLCVGFDEFLRIPKRLRFFEIDSVFGLVGLAFCGIKLEFHPNRSFEKME